MRPLRYIPSLLIILWGYSVFSQIPVCIDIEDYWYNRGKETPAVLITLSSESKSFDTIFNDNLHQTRLHYTISNDESLVNMKVSLHNSKKNIISVGIPLKGYEDSIFIEMTPNLQKRWNRSKIDIRRFYPNNLSLTINQFSEFRVSDHPMFTMDNRSDLSISAYESKDGFGGDLIRADGAYLHGKNYMPDYRNLGFWKHPLLPGDTTYLTFGIFDSYAFEMPGEHILRLNYTITNTAIDSTMKMRRNEWDIEWLDVYTIDYKFNVD